jgi:hypothetical protein
VWIINLPRYYSQDIWNEEYLIYCRIADIQLSCAKDPNTPYQIQLWGSPRIFDIGETYTISVYGIPCPRKTYINGNALYVTDSIFLAIS